MCPLIFYLGYNTVHRFGNSFYLRWPSMPDFLGKSRFLTTCSGKITVLPWPFVSDIAIFVLKRDVKLQLTNSCFFSNFFVYYHHHTTTVLWPRAPLEELMMLPKPPNWTLKAEADLGMFGWTGAPHRTGKFLQHSNMPQIIDMIVLWVVCVCAGNRLCLG